MLTPTGRCFSVLVQKPIFFIPQICNASFLHDIFLLRTMSFGNNWPFPGLYNTEKSNWNQTCGIFLKIIWFSGGTSSLCKSSLGITFSKNMTLFWFVLKVLMAIYVLNCKSTAISKKFWEKFYGNPGTFQSIYRPMVF